MGAWHGRPRQLFYAPPHFYALWFKGRLVSLSGEPCCYGLHPDIQRSPGFGTARNPNRPVVVELFSPLPRGGCTDRSRPRALRSRRYHHFRVAAFEKQLTSVLNDHVAN